MKKILVMLFMMVAATFSSPLFALDGSPPGFGSYSTNAETASKVIHGQNGLGLVGADSAADVSIIEVDILRKDTLMYSWGEGIDNKKTMKMSGCNQNANMKTIGCAIAVVCYPRGETGV